MCKNKVQFQKGLSLPDFMGKFGTETQCEAALEASKWPDGFLCGYCGHKSFSRLTRGRTRRQCNKSSGGKRGRGASKKTPFVAAISKVGDKPHQIKLSIVKGFRTNEIKQWSKKNLAAGSSVLSDGLACFRGIEKAGFNHDFLVVGNSRDTKKASAFDWVNTVLGNLKTALAGTFHKLSAHHLQRHLATFQYRFNRRYRLKDILPRLMWIAVRTPPMPRRLLTSDVY